MAEQAQVSSIDAIEAFRSNLIVFLTKARPTLEEVCNEVMRTKVWLQNDQRNFWDNQLRLRRRELERAQAELFSAKLSKLQQATGVQEMAFHRAQRAVREAEEKLVVLKKWSRELEHLSAPMLKLVEQLHGFMTTDMVRAGAYLAQAVQTLEAYADVTRPGNRTAPSMPAESGDESSAHGSEAAPEPKSD